jgi:hypothetical protein
MGVPFERRGPKARSFIVRWRATSLFGVKKRTVGRGARQGAKGERWASAPSGRVISAQTGRLWSTIGDS